MSPFFRKEWKTSFKFNTKIEVDVAWDVAKRRMNICKSSSSVKMCARAVKSVTLSWCVCVWVVKGREREKKRGGCERVCTNMTLIFPSLSAKSALYQITEKRSFIWNLKFETVMDLSFSGPAVGCLIHVPKIILHKLTLN